MKKNTTIAALMTLIIAIILTLAGGSYAANDKNTNKPAITAEKRAEMQAIKAKIAEAVKNNDYDTWKTVLESLPRGKNNPDKLTKENFDKMVTAKTLHTDLRTATENGDYNTWKTLVAKTKNGEESLKVIKNQADFIKFV